MNTVTKMSHDWMILTKQTPPIITRTTDSQYSLDDIKDKDNPTMYTNRHQPYPDENDLTLNKDNEYYAASDASLDTIHGMIQVSWAAVYGRDSRHNLSGVLDNATSTMSGEYAGAKNGITKFFIELAPNGTCTLTWWCDNMAVVGIIEILRQYASGLIDKLERHHEYMVETLSDERFDSIETTNFMQLLATYGERFSIKHVYSHKTINTTERMLNDLADDLAKKALRIHYLQFPLLAGVSDQGVSAYLRRLNQQPPMLQY